MGCAGTIEESTNFHNVPNVSKVGFGTYPTKIFLDKPGWEFKAWTDWKNSDNKSFLKRMIKLLADDGYTILLRDASHLGFPACQIIIPKMSNIYPIVPLWSRAISTSLKIIKNAPHFPKLTAQDEELILRMIRFKENSAIENQLDAIFALPVRGKRMALISSAVSLPLSRKNFSLPYIFFISSIKWKQTSQKKQFWLRELNICAIV